MAETGYTHLQWVAEMTALNDFLDTDVAGALERMRASLNDPKVGAGREHLAEVAAAQAAVRDAASTGREIVAKATAKYLPVAEAIRAAGGVGEVASNKRYNQD